ncbi:MAG: outer membrane beta-barrel protein [Parvibaculum sp.]|uniref:outer membrane beta-barrel protein n=1 Tax=Parvibaculum sp. TaxID=2024848 RepID=UPI003C7100DF
MPRVPFRSLLTTTALLLVAGAGGAMAADLTANTGAKNWSGSGMAPAGAAETQDVRGQGVNERARPGYDAVGLRAGSFVVLPSIEVAETYDDNIFATESNKDSDFITSVHPRVDVISTWSRHSLNLTAGLQRSYFADNSSENKTGYDFGMDGRLDILRDTNVTGALAHAQKHEDRGSATFSSTTAAEPVEYKQTDASIAFNQRFNRVTTTLGAAYTRLNYEDVASTAGPILDEDLRDRDVYTQKLRAGYDVSPDTNVFVQGSLNQRRYDIGMPIQDRDSKGYEAVVGSRFKLSTLASGEVYVGYQRQNYDATGLSDVSGLSYGANVNWYVTPLSTVRFNAASTIEESDLGGSSGYLRQVVGVGLDHELLRNVILRGDLSYENDDYKGTPRKDDYYGGGVGVSYLLNRFVAMGLDYDYTKRDSNAAGADYSRNRVMFTIRGQL